MNRLVKFENTSIDVQIINGIPMFELYAVGMVLGYARNNGKSASEQSVHPESKKLFPYKSRIDNIVRKAEIQPCVRNGHSYITESQIYDFMLEARTDKCRAFRKWLTNEVLPELNRNGSYSTSKMTEEKQLELYNYVEKTYFGRPVLTVADAVHFTGVDEYRINKALKSCGKVPNDYKLLTGSELAAFKRENKMLGSTAKSFTVITETGFGIICGYHNINAEKHKIFIEHDDSKLVKRPTKTMNGLMEYINREANAIIGLTYLLNSMDAKGNLELYRKNMINRINNLHGYALDVKTIII